jgi:hypothetical protein
MPVIQLTDGQQMAYGAAYKYVNDMVKETS